jgi:hypothetical protein
MALKAKKFEIGQNVQISGKGIKSFAQGVIGTISEIHRYWQSESGGGQIERDLKNVCLPWRFVNDGEILEIDYPEMKMSNFTQHARTVKYYLTGWYYVVYSAEAGHCFSCTEKNIKSI